MYSFRSSRTGENRCWLCTVTNLVLAAVIAGILYTFSPVLAAAFLTIGILLIAFVGYLVPGTPYLIRRFFPDRVLALFGKEPPDSPVEHVEEVETDPASGGDVDRLVRIGSLSVVDDDSLVLAESFEERWRSNIDALRHDE